MNKKEIKLLKQEFEVICDKYLNAFVDKQGYEFSYWIANEIGGICCFIEQYFFNLNDIRYDIENGIKKGKIFEWQDYAIDKNSKGEDYNISYENYLKMTTDKNKKYGRKR